MKKLIAAFAILVVAIAGWFVYLSHSSNTQSQVPVITVMDILHASDLQEGIKSAVENKDQKAFEEWLGKAKEVARQAALPESDLHYLESSQAEEYLRFNASRALFNDAFEQRFYRLEGIGDLKAQYPQARDLFPQAEALLVKRDAIVKSIATTLANGDDPSQEDMEKARQMWQERYRQNQETPGE